MLLEKVEANQEVHDNFQKGGKEDSFSFEICGQGFKQEKSLNVHLKNHTGAKPFACEICSKAFKQKKTFNSHVMNHNGDKPFVCEICDKKYKNTTQFQ